ncbi:sensor histidine kinase [Falcatimonas sp. MSJ-15]|uniref:sensor histidine kinase n=1 Tax=Falcatimonas sp. MSJ-15 TaxID=2841515 RepID=UPI001C110300|nr:sensor histidine kinase [Falcatimonas sp. MSJ-15]MBU5470875.1 sensor histidine kinase [Falcatimonas sp. MSJ-15]
MNKVYDYLNRRYIYYNDKKNEYVNKEHRIELNIEQIDAAIANIKAELSSADSVFKCNDNSIFKKQEIDKLLEEKETLKEEKVSLQESIEAVDLEIKELDDVLKEYQESEDINSHGMVVVESQERERQRIARDIHDSVVQTMTGLVHKSEFCTKVMDKDPIRAKLELEVINNMVRNCIDELRAIIYDLRPMSFDDLGIDVTLNRVIERCKLNTDMNITYTIEGEPYQLKSVVALSIIRIIQEACNNSIKYSKGKNIKMQLIYSKNDITLIHEDDGIGFDFNKPSNITENNTGFGISSLKERVFLLGGKISFSSNNNGVGTVIKVIIPTLK